MVRVYRLVPCANCGTPTIDDYPLITWCDDCIREHATDEQLEALRDGPLRRVTFKV